MTKAPTYTAAEINSMAINLTDAEGMKALAELINEEIELYTEEEIKIVGRATMIIFIRCLMMGSIKLLSL